MLVAVVAHNLQAGSVISGRFRLDRELGRGGMGTVWEARHLALETQVAIKFLKSELSQRQDIRVRFAREATSAARIRSSNVVSVLDSGFTEEGDYAFIVMELLLGEDLGKKLSRVGTCSLEETRNLVLQVARGLGKAHAAGILHRDLKPENLFVSNDEESTIKILDFGIAKAFGPEAATHKTDTGQLLGTPTYMSPEQALGRALDSRSDLYSLAVVAYRCLAGRTPFDYAAPGEMIVAVSMHAPPPPSQFNPALPPVVDAWFASALAKDPHSRSCQSASELADSFQLLCAEALAATPRPSTAPQAQPTLAPGSTLSNEARSFSAVELATTIISPLAVSQRARRSGLRLAAAVAVPFAALGLVLLLQRSSKQPDTRSVLDSRATPPVSMTTVAAHTPAASELGVALGAVNPPDSGSERPRVATVASSAPKKPPPGPVTNAAQQPAPELAEPTTKAGIPEPSAAVAEASATPSPPSPPTDPSSGTGPSDAPRRLVGAEAEPVDLGIDRRNPW